MICGVSDREEQLSNVNISANSEFEKNLGHDSRVHMKLIHEKPKAENLVLLSLLFTSYISIDVKSALLKIINVKLSDSINSSRFPLLQHYSPLCSIVCLSLLSLVQKKYLTVAVALYCSRLSRFELYSMYRSRLSLLQLYTIYNSRLFRLQLYIIF